MLEEGGEGVKEEIRGCSGELREMKERKKQKQRERQQGERIERRRLDRAGNLRLSLSFLIQIARSRGGGEIRRRVKRKMERMRNRNPGGR